MAKKQVIGVTGVAGFIGSQLAKRLIQLGYEVVGIDNLSKGDKKRLTEIKSNFVFKKIDLTNFNSTKKALVNVDVIVHLAAFKIPRYGNRLDTLIVNTKSTENILKIASEGKIKVIFASTSDVYGNTEEIPFTENGSLNIGSSDVARWAYAVSKIYDEQLIFAHQEKYKLPFVILRLFGVYGPEQHTDWWGGPQALFIKNILTGKTVEIHGDGRQTRSFVYIDDVLEAIVLAIKSKKAVGEIINIGTKEEISILEFAKLIAKLANKQLEIKKVAYSSFTGKKYEDVHRKKPSLKKAKQLLGWEPKIQLNKGVIKTIEWTKTQL